MQSKTCTICKQNTQLSDFYTTTIKRILKKTGNLAIYNLIRSSCKKCNNKCTMKWQSKNRERVAIRQRKAYHNQKIKLLRLMGGKCICCGNTEYWNLTFDHIIPLRSFDRKRKDIAHELLKYPEKREGFQILCHGCNSSKYIFKICKMNHNLKI